jgi:hypothetical protein
MIRCILRYVCISDTLCLEMRPSILPITQMWGPAKVPAHRNEAQHRPPVRHNKIGVSFGYRSKRLHASLMCIYIYICKGTMMSLSGPPRVSVGRQTNRLSGPSMLVPVPGPERLHAHMHRHRSLISLLVGYVNICMHMYVYIYTHICIYICVYTCIHMYIYTHTYIQTYIHTHIHTHVLVRRILRLSGAPVGHLGLILVPLCWSPCWLLRGFKITAKSMLKSIAIHIAISIAISIAIYT